MACIHTWGAPETQRVERILRIRPHGVAPNWVRVYPASAVFGRSQDMRPGLARERPTRKAPKPHFAPGGAFPRAPFLPAI